MTIVRETSQARQQLFRHVDYLRDAGQPEAAERLLQGYLDVLDRLREWPESGHRYDTEHADLKDVRLVNIKRYELLVYYRYDQPIVKIISVLHGSRGPLHVEASLRVRERM